MQNKKVLAIIQARMSSTRLPGKVLKKILGLPMLLHIVERLNKVSEIDQIVVATSINQSDKKIVNLCKKNKIDVFAGSESNVLERFHQTAKYYKGEVIMRITADCPLIDPDIVNKLIKMFEKEDSDYLAVATGAGVAKEKINKFPDGLDCEIFTFESLEKAFNEAKKTEEREHVTLYIWRGGKFKLGKLLSEKDYSFLRFVVDHPSDLKFIRMIYKNLFSENPNFGLPDIINLLKRRPGLLKINQQNIGQEGYEKLHQ